MAFLMDAEVGTGVHIHSRSLDGFVWRLWRFGWVESNILCAHGWKRLIGRLWWRAH